MALDIEGGQRPSKWATDKHGSGTRLKLRAVTPRRGRVSRVHWGQERPGFPDSYVMRCGLTSNNYAPELDQETATVDCPRCIALGG